MKKPIRSPRPSYEYAVTIWEYTGTTPLPPPEPPDGDNTWRIAGPATSPYGAANQVLVFWQRRIAR